MQFSFGSSITGMLSCLRCKGTIAITCSCAICVDVLGLMQISASKSIFLGNSTEEL
jgi:hypothetical protein